jgi:rhodanese-related sulfurtransferase
MAAIPPPDAWQAAQRGELRILDLRTDAERRRSGWPPGAEKVSLLRHAVRPDGPATAYLCQHALRSKLTRRRGAPEVAGGFAAWLRAGLPVEGGSAG